MDSFSFRYTDFNNEAPVVLSDPTPLANAAWRDADMVDVNVERPVLVYKITNLITGKLYIGITTALLRERWRSHVKDAYGSRCKGALQGAIKKYGPQNFGMELIYQAVNQREASAIERACIAERGTLWPSGYNLTTGGEMISGRRVSLETREKLREANFGKKLSAEHRQRISTGGRGKKRSAETIERMKAASKKRSALRVWTDADRAAASAKTSANWLKSGYREGIVEKLKGRKLTVEHRMAMSVAQTGREVSEETRQKLRQSILGHPGYFLGGKHTVDAKAKISAALTGKKRSAEVRKRMSEQRKADTRRFEKSKIAVEGKRRKREMRAATELSAEYIRRVVS